MESYETLQVSLDQHIARVALNRPEKSNAMNAAFWEECRRAFGWIDEEPSARVVVLSGNGRHFSSGIDLEMLRGALAGAQSADPARRAEYLRGLILRMQGAFNAIERCRVPVLAAIQGACIGGGVDLISACDMRYATTDAFFSIKEVDVGLTADMGTLQRLPHLIGDGMMRELAYTARQITGQAALGIGLVNRVFEDTAAMNEAVLGLAGEIAAKSPIAIRGTKEMIRYTRDHTVEEGLNYVATWNAGMLSQADIQEAITAQMQKRDPVFED